MLKQIKALGDKVRYINWLITEISEKQTALQNQNTELAEKLQETYRYLDKITQQIRGLEARQEKMEDTLLSQISLLEEKWKHIKAYMNPEYLLVPRRKGFKYLLVGFYGAVNLGDELMFQKIYRDLDPVKNDVYVLMCDNVDLNVFLYPGVNIIHYPQNKFDFNFLADVFDCVIYGGGAIIDDTKYFLNDSYKYDLGRIFIELSSAFIEKGKKVYSLGLSTNDRLTDVQYIAKLQHIIDNSTYFSVRDKYSAQILEKLTGHQIRQINDIVLTYKSTEFQKRPSDKYRIGIIWICNDKLKNQLYELVEYILSVYDLENTEIRFIPFYDYCNCDWIFYDKLCKEFDTGSFSIADMPHGFNEAYSEICECDLLISMRYHGALLGLKGGRRTLSLLYSQHKHYYNKMTDLYEKFQREQDLFTSLELLKRAIPADSTQIGMKIQFDNSQYDMVISELINLYSDEKEEKKDGMF